MISYRQSDFGDYMKEEDTFKKMIGNVPVKMEIKLNFHIENGSAEVYQATTDIQPPSPQGKFYLNQYMRMMSLELMKHKFIGGDDITDDTNVRERMSKYMKIEGSAITETQGLVRGIITMKDFADHYDEWANI